MCNFHQLLIPLRDPTFSECDFLKNEDDKIVKMEQRYAYDYIFVKRREEQEAARKEMEQQTKQEEIESR